MGFALGAIEALVVYRAEAFLEFLENVGPMLAHPGHRVEVDLLFGALQRLVRQLKKVFVNLRERLSYDIAKSGVCDFPALRQDGFCRCLDVLLDLVGHFVSCDRAKKYDICIDALCHCHVSASRKV